MTTPFRDALERERQRQIADVFAREGMEGLLRRGLIPDPRTNPQFMRAAPGEAGRNAIMGGGAVGLGLLAGPITPFVPEDITSKGGDLPQSVSKAGRFISALPQREEPVRGTVRDITDIISPADAATLGKASLIRGAVLGGKAARPVIREVGRAAASGPVREAAAASRAALRDEAGHIYLGEASPQRIKRFTVPAMEARRAAMEANLEKAGIKFDAIASGANKQDYFIGLEMPKNLSDDQVRTLQNMGVKDEAIDTLLEKRGGQRFFRSFDDLDRFFQTGKYEFPTIESRPSGLYPQNVFETGALPKRSVERPHAVTGKGNPEEIARRIAETQAQGEQPGPGSLREWAQSVVDKEEASQRPGRTAFQYGQRPSEAELQTAQRILAQPPHTPSAAQATSGLPIPGIRRTTETAAPTFVGTLSTDDLRAAYFRHLEEVNTRREAKGLELLRREDAPVLPLVDLLPYLKRGPEYTREALAQDIYRLDFSGLPEGMRLPISRGVKGRTLVTHDTRGNEKRYYGIAFESTPSQAAARPAPPAPPEPVGAATAPAAGQVTPAPAPAAPPPNTTAPTATGLGGTPPPGQPPVATGATPPPPPQDSVKTLTAFIKAAKPANEETRALRHQVRQRQAAQLAEAQSRVTTQEEALRVQNALRGELPVADFDPPKGVIAQEQWNGLFTELNRSPRLQPFERVRATNALREVQNGVVPVDSDLALLERVFGPEFTKSLSDRLLTTKDKVINEVLGAINLPRAIQSSFDISATLRQGSWFSTSHPKEFAGAFKEQLKALVSEEAAKKVDDALRAGPMADIRSQTPLYLAPLDASLNRAEEAFMSKVAEKYVPGVKQSQRAYVTFLNKLRADTFDTIVASWKNDGRQITEVDLKELAIYINRASGRGSLGPFKNGKFMSTLLYSPRFTTSRFEIAGSLLSQSHAVRKQAWRDFALYAGPRLTLLGLGVAGGLFAVELDPRSSDFGKIRIGDTRIDPWGGWQPVVRYMAQAMTNRRKNVGTGAIEPIGRSLFDGAVQTLLRFGRSKLAPLPSTVVDVTSGRTFTGDKVTWSKELRDRFMPLLASDILDVYQEYGPERAAATAPLSTLGLGVQTYKTPSGVAPKEAMEGYFKLPANDTEAKAKRLFTREAYRAKHPDVDAQLFLAGDVTSLKTLAARAKVLEYMRKNKVKVADIRALEEEEYESPAKNALRRWFQQALGEGSSPALKPGVQEALQKRISELQAAGQYR